MIFLIDIGNSRTKYVQIANQNTLNEQLSAVTQVSNDEFSSRYFTEFFSEAKQVVIANVGNALLTDNLASWCEKNTVSFTQVHSEQQKNTLISAYQEPTTLGIDRWLALMGAIDLYPNNTTLIIDAGTATTVDLLASNGQHHGGWILAGVKALFDSILHHSTLVSAKSTAAANLAFGQNTTDNVNNACWAATLGLVEQAIDQAQQFAAIDHLIFTGGNGQTLMQLLLTSDERGDNAYKKRHYQVQYIEKLIFFGLKNYC